MKNSNSVGSFMSHNRNYPNSFHKETLKCLFLFLQQNETQIQVNYFQPGYDGICGRGTTASKGYQVSGCSVFKCEMSSKVIRHMIRVATWQRCTYRADLEDRKRERERAYKSLSTHFTAHSTLAGWCCVVRSKHSCGCISAKQSLWLNMKSCGSVTSVCQSSD